MKVFDVQGILLDVPQPRAFAYIASPENLPEWTAAFAKASCGKALLRTPSGEIEIGLQTITRRDAGTVDWVMNFPGGVRATAFSRLVDLDGKRCIYSFVLTPPPVPLEALEGALEVQSETLAKELKQLKQILERS